MGKESENSVDIKQQLEQATLTANELAAENARLQKTIEKNADKIKPTVEVDGVNYVVRFKRAVVPDGDGTKVVTAEQIAADAVLAKSLIGSGCLVAESASKVVKKAKKKGVMVVQ